MGASTHRVIQWANTGQRALCEMIRDPILGLDSAKDGVDAGELCGKPATGIRVAAAYPLLAAHVPSMGKELRPWVIWVR
jgi:hypothetical protein